MKIGQKIGERSVEIIKSSEFTKYLAEKVHQTNDPDETFGQKLLIIIFLCLPILANCSVEQNDAEERIEEMERRPKNELQEVKEKLKEAEEERRKRME